MNLMRKCLLFIGILLALRVGAANTIQIPIKLLGVASLLGNSPTGSTPDPTDPNQFRASLTGNMLMVNTQKNAVSYVVIQESESERRNEDYFYAVSLDSVSCPISHAGLYTIRIGYWNMDYIGYLRVTKIAFYDLKGRFLSETLDTMDELPAGYYIVRLETNYGNTTIKFYHQP